MSINLPNIETPTRKAGLYRKVSQPKLNLDKIRNIRRGSVAMAQKHTFLLDNKPEMLYTKMNIHSLHTAGARRPLSRIVRGHNV